MKEEKGLTLTILGMVSIIGIIGLVLLFTKFNTTGAIVTMAGCDSPSTPVLAEPGVNPNFLPMYQEAGYTCVPGLVDDFGMTTWCCTPPSNVPVNPHADAGQAPMTDVSYYGYAGYRNTLGSNMG
ncbi:hypothetical protein KY314_01990 [Candidatus Woesearchaeota archaeon]|nr:hypothetical protein [Candidatus Woesearchaeota archaeon]